MNNRARYAALLVATGMGVASVAVLPQAPAWAFPDPGVASVPAVSEVPLASATASQPLNSVKVAFADSSSSHVWAAGDKITFQLWDAATGAALSQTPTNVFESASFSALPSVSATNGVNATYYSVALAKGATSSVNDEFVLTFLKAAPQDANTTTFTISGLKTTLGSRIPAGHHIQLRLTASNGTPFTGSSAVATAAAGIIPAGSLSTSGVVTAAPSTAGVGLGTLTFKDVTGGAVNAGDEIDLTLTAGSFSAPGTSTGALFAGTPTVITVNRGSDTLKMTAAKTSSVNDLLRVGGAKITMPAGAAEVFLVANDKTTATVVGAAGVATVVKQARVGGVDRYATASQLYESAFALSSVAVLVSGTNYPDALSAVYLARGLGTGVLTTDPNNLPAATRNELVAHAINTVYIVGGTSAVSANVAAQVGNLHVGNNSSAPKIAVARIAGGDRYATNQLVDSQAARSGSTTAIVATGQNFADALAVGPAVYVTGDPLILTDPLQLSAAAKSTISTLRITHVVIVGGTSAVSSAVESQLGAAGATVDYRIAGADRTQTAAAVAQWETSGLPGVNIYTALPGLNFGGTGTVNIARGDSFADALAAGSVAGKVADVLVLTADPTTLGAGIPSYLSGRAGATSTLRAIGGAGALYSTTMTAAALALSQPLVLP